MRFEGVKVISLPFRWIKEGAAFTLPGIGIFVAKESRKDTQLLMHEFGHILQFRKWGGWLFWKHIAPDSLKSARQSQNNHMDCWTEWSANRLSYEYFEKPDSWNFNRFPILPSGKHITGKPKFTANNEEFLEKWVEV